MREDMRKGSQAQPGCTCAPLLYLVGTVSVDYTGEGRREEPHSLIIVCAVEAVVGMRRAALVDGGSREQHESRGCANVTQ